MEQFKFSEEEKFNIYINDAKHPFSGWDFSHIRDRMVTEPLSWSYSSELLPYLRNAECCLDMGTGGGEFLSSLQPLPKKTFATEAYSPNVPIAKKRLHPLNVNVIEIKEKDPLPFADNFFDLIINRHEYYDSKEVFRILKTGGLFITQQVGAKNDIELNYLLEDDFTEEKLDYNHWTLEYAKKELQDIGFELLKMKESFPKTRIFDIGTIIYYLKAIPWQFPNFEPEIYLEELRKIHKKIEKEGFIEITSHYFLCSCQKV